MVRESQVVRVRRFNRLVTQRIGALSEDYLARRRPLGASRLLWEIGDDTVDLRDLRARLGLDSGYVTRLVGRLRDEGLVTVVTDPDDQRVRAARSTPAGRAEQSELDRASDRVAGGLLEPLDEDEREQLITAMTTVERLLLRHLLSVEPLDPSGPESALALRAYFAELRTRFPRGFDPRQALLADDDELRGERGVLLGVRLSGELVGAGAVKTPPGQPALIKRMWVARSARGFGVGRRLLTELEDEARRRGARVIRLDTNTSLVEAVSLYRAGGYTEIEDFNGEPHADLWFAKQL